MQPETASIATEPADDTIALSERLVPPTEKNQRAFRLALVAAFLVHASVFIEIGRSVPRTIGDRSGVSDAIAVDLVTEADLRSRETVAMPPAGAPTPPPAAAPAPETPKPPDPQREPPKPEPEAAVPAPKEPAPQETPQKQAALPDFETVLQDLATSPLPREEAKQEPEKSQETKDAKESKEAPQETAKPAEKKEPPPPAKKKAQAQEQARLDPREFQNAPPGRSAAASRPPGITRSGENDEFGRAVIRALRQTMPPPRGIFGRVTVRLILTENGDLAEVRVLDASGTSLDQSVVFATRQTYFPLPPYNATVADRTFLITYVYR